MKKLLFFVLALIFTKLNAQIKFVTPSNQQWLQYYHYTKINKKYTNITDCGMRFDNKLNTISQVLLRSSIDRKILKNYSVAAGLALFTFKKKRSDPLKLKNMEIRPFIEFNKTKNHKNFTLKHRIRLEERCYYSYPALQNIDPRLRYKIYIDYPLKDKKIINDKISLNLGYECLWQKLKGPNTHRLIAGFTYKMSKKNSISLLYMYYGNSFNSFNEPKLDIYRNVLWLSVTHK